jgi:hypothetical protein
MLAEFIAFNNIIHNNEKENTNMKKLFLSLLLVGGLTAEVTAQSFDSYSFLAGWHTIISNNVTVLYGATNIYFADTSTNLLASLTNTYYAPYFNNGAFYWTNSLLTNASVSAFGGPFGAWHDVPTWSDRNGNTPSNVSIQVSISGEDASATNLVTFIFAKVANGGVNQGQATPPRGQYNPPLNQAETVTANRLQFTMNGNGTTPVTLITNLTSGFFGGAGSIRLISVQTSNSNTNTILNTVALAGFSP